MAGEKIKRVDLIQLLFLTQYRKFVGSPFADYTDWGFSVIGREEIASMCPATPRSGERRLRINTPTRCAWSKRSELL